MPRVSGITQCFFFQLAYFTHSSHFQGSFIPFGLPWQCSGYDSMLPVQGSTGSIPSQRSSSCCEEQPKRRKNIHSFLRLNNIPLHVHITFLSHSLIYGHLDCFLLFVNTAAVRLVYKYLFGCCCC